MKFRKFQLSINIIAEAGSKHLRAEEMIVVAC